MKLIDGYVDAWIDETLPAYLRAFDGFWFVVIADNVWPKLSDLVKQSGQFLC